MKTLLLTAALLALGSHAAKLKKLTGQKLNVVTILSPPFTYEEDTDGEKEFRGFLPDLLKELENKLGFQSEMHVVADGKYGYIDDDGTWHGMVGELLDGQADMALAPLTVNGQREAVVKFTVPYMNAGLVPITQRPSSGQPLPFLDVMGMVQEPLKYGCVSQGSTYQFFQNNTHPLYKAMGMVLADNPDLTVASYEDGIKRVRDEPDYVFFGEDTAMKFYAGQEPCDLMVIGKPLNDRFYALAFPQDKADLASIFNIALLELNERGVKDRLYDKWWEDDCKAPQYCICEKPTSSEESGSQEAEPEPEPEVKEEKELGDEKLIRWI